MTFLDRQSATPLVAALKASALRSYAAFHTPGHKKGQGISPRLGQWWGAALFQADLPELPELDNLFAPEGVILQAQILAAEAFGAEQSWFLANGSTCGIEAAVLASCSPGEKLILPRNAHRSAISALILSGAVPVWLEPAWDAEWEIAHAVAPETVATALEQHPDAKAVLLVSPTYYGVCGDLATIAQQVHQYGIPLLIDEAHGTHFAFHPELPTPALTAGADVAVQSVHKTLSALTQAALLHTQGTRIDRDRLSRALQLVQSTSPNYLLLASLDAARQQMALQGQELMHHTLNLAAAARLHLNQILGLKVLSPQMIQALPGGFDLDRTRLTVDVSGLGLTGFAADEQLHQVLGVTAELPGLRHLTFIITLGNTKEDLDRLVGAFQTLAQSPLPLAASTFLSYSGQLQTQTILSPREAFFASSCVVAAEQAIDQISAELICPYPPGIPLIIPGEVITADALHRLQQILTAGGILAGCADPTLQTLKIIQA